MTYHRLTISFKFNLHTLQIIEKQGPGIAPAEPPSNSVQQNESDNPTTLPGRKEASSLPPETKRRRPESIIGNKDPGTRPPIGIAQRIYISNRFDPDLRQALADSFTAHGVALVGSTEEADAILEARAPVKYSPRIIGRTGW